MKSSPRDWKCNSLSTQEVSAWSRKPRTRGKGQFIARLKLGDQEVEQELFVIKNLHKYLLGRLAIEALDLVVYVGAVQEDPVVH